MRKQLRHISYANVVATLALVLAMSGSAYALVVTGALVADESLTEADVRDRSLSRAIADNAVRGPQVGDDSLTGDDIDESSLQIPAGSAGKNLLSFGSVSGGLGSQTVVVRRELPPGKYALFADITVSNRDGVAHDVLCIINGGLGHNPQTTVPAGGHANLSIADQTEIGGSQPFTVTLTCGAPQSPGLSHLLSAYGTLSAIRVDEAEWEQNH